MKKAPLVEWTSRAVGIIQQVIRFKVIIALFGKRGLMKSRKLTWQAKWFCVGLISLVFSAAAYVVSLAYVNFTK